MEKEYKELEKEYKAVMSQQGDGKVWFSKKFLHDFVELTKKVYKQKGIDEAEK